MATFVRDRVLYRARQAFLRWANYVVNEDFMMRANALSLKAARIQYLTQVFWGWRQAVVHIKAIKRSWKVRIWKILVKNMKRRRQMQASIQLVLRGQLTHERYTLSQCFAALRAVAKQERQDDNYDYLRKDVDVAID